MSARVLSVLGRWRIAAWLGVAGMGVQAMLPLFLALALATAPCPGAVKSPGVSAIHADHAGHHGNLPAPHSHATNHCLLCQSIQSGGTATLPGSLALHLPRDAAHVALAATTTLHIIGGSPAAYISRAPPASI